MKTFVLALLLAAAPCLAADVTGKWSGSLVINQDGDTKNETAYLILKQEGSVLTGTAGPDVERQRPFQNGKVDGDAITFEVQMGERTMTFKLQADGDNITGSISGPGKDGGTDTAKLSVKRVAEK